MHAGLGSRMTILLWLTNCDNDDDDDASKAQAEAGDLDVKVMDCVPYLILSFALTLAGAAGMLPLILVDDQRGKRAHACSWCPRTFKSPSDLKRHELTHTGEKPFKCEHCDYASTRAGDLQTHMRIHTGEKPFKCAYCEYSPAIPEKGTCDDVVKPSHTRRINGI